MKVLARSLVVIFVVLIAVPALAVTYTLTTTVQLLATTALIMGGTEHPLSNPPDTDQFITDYMDDAEDNYIIPTGLTPDSRVAVVYPAQFFPVFGQTTFDDSVLAGRNNLNSCIRNGPCNGGAAVPRDPEDTFVGFGYSQSAVVASLVKRDLIANPAGAPTNTEFVIIANPMRKNGGILARGFEGQTIPGLGITFHGGTPTNSPVVDPGGPGPEDDVYAYPTTDVAQQHDLLGGDAPAVPWNVLSWLNSGASYALLHGDVPNRSIAGVGDPADPKVIYQDTVGDTDYYMITAPLLPMFMPLEMAGVPGPLLAVVDAPARVLVEWGHYHGTSPGQHVQFQLLPETDPITMLVNLAVSVPVGIDDGLQGAGLGRALGTDDVYRPFGVGGQAYDKTSGLPVDDETAPLNALDAVPLNVAAAPDPGPPVALAGDTPEINPTPEIKSTPQETELENDAPEGNAPAESTKPRPLRDVLRLPIQFDRPDRPATRQNGQNGDGPLRRVINALTGQRPDPTPEPASDDKPKESEQPAA